MKRTKYTINELEGKALEKALEYVRDCTGMTDRDDLIIEADAYQQLFYKDGTPARN
ncbi:MAG: hypothetical protein J6U01_01280 [Clostridia bacterium]|nr:hypothetical protein [Clostridia bacterium]